MKRSATERAKDTPCASWHVSAFGVVGFHVPRGSAAGMCLFLFPAANREHTTGKEKDFFRTALAISQLEVYIIVSSLPEKWDRRILTFFSVCITETWKLLLKKLYRSKACQNAYLRILACLCFCNFSGFPSALLCAAAGMCLFYFLPQTGNM